MSNVRFFRQGFFVSLVTSKTDKTDDNDREFVVECCKRISFSEFMNRNSDVKNRIEGSIEKQDGVLLTFCVKEGVDVKESFEEVSFLTYSILPSSKILYVDLLCVKQEVQDKGLEALMMRHIFDYVDLKKNKIKFIIINDVKRLKIKTSLESVVGRECFPRLIDYDDKISKLPAHVMWAVKEVGKKSAYKINANLITHTKNMYRCTALKQILDEKRIKFSRIKNLDLRRESVCLVVAIGEKNK